MKLKNFKIIFLVIKLNQRYFYKVFQWYSPQIEQFYKVVYPQFKISDTKIRTKYIKMRIFQVTNTNFPHQRLQTEGRLYFWF